MQIHVSAEVNAIFEKALGFSVRQGQFYVGVEHVFAAVLDDPDQLPPSVRDRHLNTLYTVLREVNRTAWSTPVATPRGEVFHTPRCIAVLNQAAKLAERHGRGPARAGHVLLAILADGFSAPSRAMDTLNLNRKDCLELLRAELGGSAVTERHAADIRHISSPPERQSVSVTRGLSENRVQPGAPLYSPMREDAGQSGTGLHASRAVDGRCGRQGSVDPVLRVLVSRSECT